MIGDAVSQAVANARSRAEHAADQLANRILVGTVGGIICSMGIGFGLLGGFFHFEPIYGSVRTALIIAAACLIVGLLILTVAYRERDMAPVEPAIEPLAVVRAEAREVADYVGPIRLVATALSAGFTIAKFLKR